MARTLDPEVVERTKRECEEQGIPLGFTDDTAIARIGRSLFSKNRPTARKTAAPSERS